MSLADRTHRSGDGGDFTGWQADGNRRGCEVGFERVEVSLAAAAGEGLRLVVDIEVWANMVVFELLWKTEQNHSDSFLRV